jgi:hypothetical protein
LTKFEKTKNTYVQTKNKVPKLVLAGHNDNGYGNRLYGGLSSLLISILLDARLFIDWPKIDKYIQEPFHGAFNKSLYLKYSKVKLSDPDLVFEAKSKSAWLVNKNVETLSKQTIPEDKLIYHFNGFDAYFFELCCVPRYQQHLVDYGLVDGEIVKKAQDALNDKNATLSYKQDAVLKVGFEVGHSLLHHFWKINTKFQSFIDRFYDEFFKGFTVITIQLRYEYISWEDSKIFVDCAQRIEKQIINKTSIKWFVTSDNEQNVRKLEAKYKIKVVHTLDFIKENKVENEYAKYGSTILDNELMSKSDFLILSGGSTFGFTAAIKMKTLPFYVNGNRNQKECYKMKLSEPSITNTGYAVF